MLPVFKEIGVDYAVVGNHDFDFGEDILSKLLLPTAPCKWLLSNVTHKSTGLPIGNSHKYTIDEWNGVKFGFFAVIENSWLDSLNFDTSDFDYKDFVEVSKQMVELLRAEGAQVIVCMTHMRLNNDIALAEAVPGIDLILGSHDHFYHEQDIGTVHLVKAGIDFKWLAKVTIYVSGGKTKITSEKITITKEIPEDENVKKIVSGFKDVLEDKMKKEMGFCHTELDCTRPSLRTGDTSSGNFICDVIKDEFSVDISLINSGTIRTETVHPAGPVTLKRILEILPYEDIIVTATIKGADVWAGLENGVSKLPVLEGRFPQVSGLRFTFDSTLPEGKRVLSLEIGEDKVDKDSQKIYTIATKTLLLEGKDGYEAFTNAQWTMEKDNGQLLSLLITNHFHKLRVLHALKIVMSDSVKKALGKWQHHSSVKKSLIAISPICDGRIVDISKKK